jgi:hypothetical protein
MLFVHPELSPLASGVFLLLCLFNAAILKGATVRPFFSLYTNPHSYACCF